MNYHEGKYATVQIINILSMYADVESVNHIFYGNLTLRLCKDVYKYY